MRLLLCFALLSACGGTSTRGTEAPSGPVSGGSPRATLDRVKVSTDLSALRAAIKMYTAENEGALPPSLDSLGVTGLHYADHYRYDASAGTVSCPELPNL